MNKQHVKGAANQVKGAVKEAYGKVANDPAARVGGKIDQLKGKAQVAVGDVKDSLKDGVRKAEKELDK